MGNRWRRARDGNFDDTMIYAELKRPTTERSIPAEHILREEAVEVLKKYKTMAGRAQY